MWGSNGCRPNDLDRRTIYGYTIDIQTDKQTVDAHREGSQHSLLYFIGV